MSGQETTFQKRLRWSGVIILGLGLFASAVVFKTPPPEDNSDIIGYVHEGGQSFPIRRGDSKSDIDQMKGMGGAANVAATEFRQWFRGLWHGRKLAYTLAILSVGGFCVCFLLAHYL